MSTGPWKRASSRSIGPLTGFARAEVRRGFDGHQGFVGDLFADFVLPLAEKWSFSVEPRLSLADADALRPYFGIDGVQSAASGLTAFDPKED